MKKNKTIFVCILFVLSCCFLLAEEPESLVKKSTAGLFEDELIDKLDEGIDFGNAFLFGGYKSHEPYNFNLGYGMYFGSYWFSIYDAGLLNDNNLYIVNKKYGLGSKSHLNNQKNLGKNIYNELYFSVNAGKFDSQLYWILEDNDINNKKEVSENEINNNDGNTKTKSYNEDRKILSNSDIGVNINNVKFGTNSMNNSFFSLDKIGVFIDIDKTINRVSSELIDIQDESKLNENSTEEIVSNGFVMPYIKGSYTTDLFEIGRSLTQLVIGEQLGYYIYLRQDTNKSEKLVSVSSTSPDTDNTIIRFTLTPFDFENIFSSKFITTYDFDYDLQIKSSLGFDFLMSHFAKRNNKKIRTQEIYSNGRKRIEDEDVAGGTVNQNEDTFEFDIIPELSLGIVYKIIPEKLDFYLGAKVYPSQMALTVVKKSNDSINKTHREISFDQDGDEVVDVDTSETLSSSGEDVTTYDFNFSNSNPNEFWIGGTFWFNRDVKLDLVYSACFSNYVTNGPKYYVDQSVGVTFAMRF